MDALTIPLQFTATADTTQLKRRLTIIANGFEDAAEALRRTVANLDKADRHDPPAGERFSAETVQTVEADILRFREARARAEEEAGRR